MQESFELNAEVRTDMGKGASRRLRREGKVPAILYGGGKDPMSLLLSHNELLQHLENEAFYSHILKVKVDGKDQQAVLKDVQRHPARPLVLHIDLMRVKATDVIRMLVPIHFVNEGSSKGVKTQGGVIAHALTDVEVLCKAKDLPEFIEVDVADLGMGESIHLSELKLPKGVEIAGLTPDPVHDLAVVSINKGRKEIDELAEEGEGEGEGPSEEQAEV